MSGGEPEERGEPSEAEGPAAGKGPGEEPVAPRKDSNEPAAPREVPVAPRKDPVAPRKDPAGRKRPAPAPKPPPVPNLLVAYTVLFPLARVPMYAEMLWSKVHSLEGRCVRVSGLFLRTFADAFERIGLAEVARSEIERYASKDGPPGSIYLRYHTIALFEHVARSLTALASFVREFWEVDALFSSEPNPLGQAQQGASLSNVSLIEQLGAVDAGLGEKLERRRKAILRIEKLAQDAARPGALRFGTPETAAAFPIPDDPGETFEASELGIGRSEASLREWLPIGELATTIVADAALVAEDIARAAIERIEGGGRVDLDLRIEV